MKIVQRQIEEVVPYEKNAKKHTDAQVKQIVNSINEFGFNQPIVVDKKGVIIVGHGRYLAAQLMGMDTVPVLEVELDEERATAYRLADNKLNESDWDMKLVIEELKSLSIEMIELTGFDKSLALDDDDKDDMVPWTPKVPKTKLGDAYTLGRHTVVCADSTDPKVYTELLKNLRADMVFTDPPYNVDYSGRGEETKTKIMNDHMTAEKFNEFLNSFFEHSKNFVKAGGGWYIFHSSSSQAQFEKSLKLAGLEVRAQLIWNKPTASMGWGDYRWKHEPFFYAGKKGSEITFYGDRTHTTILDFHASEQKLINWARRQKKLEAEGKTTIWTMKRDNVGQYKHPTQKPVELIAYALVNSSKEGDIVLDPFAGSGSTLIACEKLGRICLTIELDPKFVDVVVQRYVDFTGRTEVEKNGKAETWELSEEEKEEEE